MIMYGNISLNNVGKFNQFVRENSDVLESFFHVPLFPGSINIDITYPENIHQLLDSGTLAPDFIIPVDLFKNIPSYLGNGQAWKCKLQGVSWKEINAWVFRRIGSRVCRGEIEIVSDKELNKPYGLKNKEKITCIID